MNDAFSRKIEREKRDESTGKIQNEVQRGRGRVLFTLYTQTSKMATGLQLAAYYLLYGNPYICSHKFDMIIITHLMNVLNGRQQDMLISPTSFKSFRPKICDYLDRSDALEKFSYTLWTALYRKALPGSKAVTDDKVDPPNNYLALLLLSEANLEIDKLPSEDAPKMEDTKHDRIWPSHQTG